jgi:hypothetical protein
MQEFTVKYADKIQGVLSGFDRLVFRGSLRKICHPFGMQGYLWAIQVPLKEFGKHVNKVSGQVKDGAVRCILEAGRPVKYLASSKDDKEKIARSIAQQDKVTQGPVCALTCWNHAGDSTSIAIVRPRSWTWCNAHANACTYISIGIIRFSDG